MWMQYDTYQIVLGVLHFPLDLLYTILCPTLFPGRLTSMDYINGPSGFSLCLANGSTLQNSEEEMTESLEYLIFWFPLYWDTVWQWLCSSTLGHSCCQAALFPWLQLSPPLGTFLWFISVYSWIKFSSITPFHCAIYFSARVLPVIQVLNEL